MLNGFGTRQIGLAGCFAVGLLSLAGGCGRGDHEIPDAAEPRPSTLYQPFDPRQSLPEQKLNRPPYRLTPGDVVEIIYQVKNEVTDKDYVLKIEDKIKVAFPYQEKFNQELAVSGDGNIRCLLVGRIRVAGKTAEEVEQELLRRYAEHIKDPELTVVVEAANVKIEELKRAITTAPRGQSRLVPIKPDGTIDLPYIGEAHVSGLTVNQAKHMLDTRYVEEDLQEVEVTVQTLKFAPRRIYVHGEVLTNGMLNADAPITLMQALATMGGVNTRAEKSKILLVRRKHVPIPEAIVFDMTKFLEPRKPGPEGAEADGSIYRYDPYLADGDLIYVPPTWLAQSNDWIDQVFTRGIRAIFPYSGYVGVNFGYDIRNAPQTIKTDSVGAPQVNTNFGP